MEEIKNTEEKKDVLILAIESSCDETDNCLMTVKLPRRSW